MYTCSYLRHRQGTLDRDGIEASTAAVHADLNAGLLEAAGEKLARQLKSLVRVEDLRPPIGSQRSLQSGETKGRVARIGQFPGENLSACPVHDSDQVQVPFGHGNVAEIGCPDLIRTVNGQVAEQVGGKSCALEPAGSSDASDKP